MLSNLGLRDEFQKTSTKGVRKVVVRIINMLPDKLVMAGIIVLIL